jgi:integration host factor subunit beta
MTKSDLINQLGRLKGIPGARAESIVEAIFASIEAALTRGERIEIRGLGSFEIRQYGAYACRNPRTGEKVAVEPKRLPFFKVGKEMKERINQRAPLTRAAAASAAAAAAAETPALTDATVAASIGAS